jgi:hypothetical protein
MSLNKQMTALRSVAVARAEIACSAGGPDLSRADRADEDLRTPPS